MKHKALYGDGTKRIRPEGCWSFCGGPGKCTNEELGLCRTFVPRIECPPPNQGCPDIRNLVFGKKEYLEDPAYLKYEKELMKAFEKGIPINSVLNWRPVSDPFALVPIFMDPRKFIKNERIELWKPDRFQDAIMSSGDIITAISEAGKYE